MLGGWGWSVVRSFSCLIKKINEEKEFLMRTSIELIIHILDTKRNLVLYNTVPWKMHIHKG